MGERGGGRRHHLTLESGDHLLHLYAYKSSSLRTVSWSILRTIICNSRIVSTSSSLEAKMAYQIVPRIDGSMEEVEEVRWFIYRKLHYIWIEEKMVDVNDEKDGRWVVPGDILSQSPPHVFHHIIARQTGLSDHEVNQRIATYGLNSIEIQLRSIPMLLFMEAISPFYIFQIFSVTVWYNDEYCYYASVIVIMSVCSIVMDVIQTRGQEKRLRAMVHSSSEVEVIRNGGFVTRISSEKLVPGDILLIPPHGCLLQCDAVLMNGTVIVNESMLTGESVPVTKRLSATSSECQGIFYCFLSRPRILLCSYTVLKILIITIVLYNIC
ncbi:IC domain protein, HAD ATPase, P-type family [Dictyocaulus viviparus]|uniref:IC domain protein, HAD ATPase, P-type family n=1 Tax=Dictyocaulus viviparus TaxID=29172 RepID=A0A0D8Y7J8_DICVI|nr:IC domain protein, HAD ATPase, P-type family [Dictyocaulus viviparus]